jgi:predicted nucleic acid-binding protein
MTLIDTSAWIEFFRRKGDPLLKGRVLEILTADAAAYTCPIRFELVLGARPEEMADLVSGLDLAKRVTLTPAHWDMAASIGAELRLQGIQIPTSDLLIASVARQEGIPLLTNDDHFTLLREKVLPDLVLS